MGDGEMNWYPEWKHDGLGGLVGLLFGIVIVDVIDPTTTGGIGGVLVISALLGMVLGRGVKWLLSGRKKRGKNGQAE